MGWYHRKVECSGSVLFRGSLPPRAEEFAGLQEHGIQLSRLPDRPNAHWALAMSHPQWGQATLLCPREALLPPGELIDFAPDLSPEEKQRAHLAESAMVVTAPGDRGHVLRDRKRLLHFLGAVVGREGVVVMDHLSEIFWSREALDDEVCHDADLDIEGLYTLHAVTGETLYSARRKAPEGEPVTWLHTHGLAQLGFLDFDILRPSPDLQDTASDQLRAIAFAIVEERLKLATPRFGLYQPGGQIRLVSVPEFTRKARPEDVALRSDTDSFHDQNRAVVCEPASLLGRWFGAVEPSRFLSGSIPDTGMILFSNEATNLMAERARLTYPQFRAFRTEFAEFDFPCLAKLGYAVDGGSPDDREHLWFEVHAAEESRLEGTLDSAPFYIARMRQGQRGWHDPSLLSDWTIITPAGWITPRNATPARALRPRLDELRKSLARSRPS